MTQRTTSRSSCTCLTLLRCTAVPVEAKIQHIAWTSWGKPASGASSAFGCTSWAFAGKNSLQHSSPNVGSFASSQWWWLYVAPWKVFWVAAAWRGLAAFLLPPANLWLLSPRCRATSDLPTAEFPSSWIAQCAAPCSSFEKCSQALAEYKAKRPFGLTYPELSLWSLLQPPPQPPRHPATAQCHVFACPSRFPFFSFPTR